VTIVDRRGWLDRLLNRTIDTPAKAAVGPGVISLQNDIPLWRLGDMTYAQLHKRSQRLMKEAQQVSYANPWIRAAERTISARGSSAPWHFEDRDGKRLGDEKGDKAPDALTERLMALLEKPNPNMTGRALKHITVRHMGVVGNGCWFLDSQDLYGLPEAIYYLNPARLVPILDANGNLAFWSLDPTEPDGSGGTKLRGDEVLHFQLEPPDWGVWAVGLVESAQSRIELDRLAIRHASQSFAAGGRLPGVLSPKTDGSLTPEQLEQLQRDVRNIVELPDASKRTLVASGPLEFTPTAQKATDLQLTDIAQLGRDDIAALWGVPISQLGMPVPAGLNSDLAAHDEAVLWQGAIHPRLDILREMVQFRLADKLPNAPQIVVEEPEFDDQTPRYEMAEKARVVPLTNQERREILGLEPFPKEHKELNEAVYLPKDMVRIDLPEMAAPPLTVATEPAAPREMEEPKEPEEPGKAKGEPFTALRTNLQTAKLPELQKALAAYLARVRKHVASAVRAKGEHIARKPKDPDAWWDTKKWDRELRDLLTSELRPLAESVTGSVAPLVRKQGKADGDVTERAIALVLEQGAAQVADINAVTRERLAELIGDGIAEGLSAAELGDRIEEAAVFSEERAERIARTEFGRAYNTAALETYGAYGVEQVQAIDGDEDAECAARNGLVLSRHEASGITDHPNGTLDWVPVL
jgi:HK97 family phage portal protein